MSDQYKAAIGKALQAFGRLIAPYVADSACRGMSSETVRQVRDQLIRYDASVLVALIQKHWREVHSQDLGAECRECIDTIGWACASWEAEQDFTKESALEAIDCALEVLARAGVKDVGSLEEVRHAIDGGERRPPGSA